MSTTISELWNGNLAPVEHCGAHDSQANHICCLIEKHREALLGELSGEQRATFQKYIDYSDRYLLRMMELSFCDGFRIGGRLTMEIACDI